MDTASVYQIFNLSLAQKYGVSKAIIIYQFESWSWKCEHSHGKINGRAWVIKPMTGIAKAFPYWSYGQVRYHVLSLVELGVLDREDFGNQIGFSFSDEYMFLYGGLPEVKQ